MLAALIVSLVAAQVPRVNPATAPVVKAVGFGLPGIASSRLAVGTPGGQEAEGWIELSGPAVCQFNCDKVFANGKSAGGMNVSVSSANPSLAKVQTPVVFFLTGETRKTFHVLTSAVNTQTDVKISAAREGSPAQGATLHILPPSLVGFTVDPATVMSGATAHASVTFSGSPASAGAVVREDFDAESERPPGPGQRLFRHRQHGRDVRRKGGRGTDGRRDSPHRVARRSKENR
jgi:hypothetical protein